ncbi:MAG: condensation domain-containing protein, partial [Bacillota bacterium]|nr:condensation domain-containing protein [Bacillota bacterium]
MDNINVVNRYVLQQVKDGKMEKDMALLILKELVNATKKENNDIAIIGMSCRYSKADNKEEYFNNLSNGFCSIGDFPESRRKNIEPFRQNSGKDQEPLYLKAGFLEETDKFDAAFFRISPKEASLMDPKQRLFLETVYEAMEDAGYGGDKLSGSEAGIYVGNEHSSEFRASYSALINDHSDMLATTGTSSGILASRAAYIFDLRGPNMVIDTACSSSLVSVHLACEALNNKNCTMAIAGGANLFMCPTDIGMMNDISSNTPKVRVFDKNAKGTVWGEGVSAIVLKPLNKAIEDRDNIYAVIKGSAINNNGASNGIAAPNADAQEKLILKAWKKAGINPETISYIETQGTGTVLGDPIEIKGITNAFRRYTDKKQFCGVGTVKPNIGHTVGASGMASLIKVVMAMKHGVIPPSINFEEPSKFIDFKNSPVYFNDKLNVWEKGDVPRRAGVSSFGFSGTNSHVVIEEAPVSKENTIEVEKPIILAISAKNKDSLKDLITKYKAFVDKNENCNLDDFCYTANTGRRHCEHRVFVVGKDKDDFKKKLKTLTYNGDSYERFSEIQKGELKRLASQKIDEFIEGGKLDLMLLTELGQYYGKGIDLDWNKLYEGDSRKRISIPTYPFLKERHWLNLPHDSGVLKKSNLQGTGNKAVDEIRKIELQGRANGEYSETEMTMGQIWGSVLGFHSIDVNSDFYEIGGDSIIALNIANTVSKSMNIKIETTDLFKYPSIEKISFYIDTEYLNTDTKTTADSSILKLEDSEYYDTSSSQKRMFVVNKFNRKDTAYNIPLFFMIEGALDKDKMEDAFSKIISRHETLRTSFHVIEGKIVQRIEKNIDFSMEKLKGCEEELNNLIQNFTKPFNLSKTPLIRASLVEINSNKHLLMINLHHIIADGFSMPILVNEFIGFYEGRNFTDLKIQFRDFAKWQNERLEAKHIKVQEEYWLDIFKDKVSPLKLPLDFPRPDKTSTQGDTLIFYLEHKLTDEINRYVSQTNATLFMVLLAAFNILLSKHSKQEDIIIGSPISGRIDKDVQDIIGMFVNSLALRNYPEAKKSFKTFLSEVKESSIKAYENQEYPYEKLIDKLEINGKLEKNVPLFNTMFTLQITDNTL